MSVAALPEREVNQLHFYLLWRNEKQRDMRRVNKVDVVHPKVPDPQEHLSQYFRSKLGESLYVEPAEFDTSDKDIEVTCGSYNSLHDPHLKKFFNERKRKELLFKQGLITQDDQVLCSLKELNRYMRYIQRVQLSWNKLFQQEQKKLLKKFMVLKLDGGVPENISTAHLKDWLIHRGRTTFRKIYKKNIKQGSNLNNAEMAWEVTQRIQLDELEKDVLRELRIEHRIPPMEVPSEVKNLREGIFAPSCSPESTLLIADDQANGTTLAQDLSRGSSLVSPPTGTSIQKTSQLTDEAAAILEDLLGLGLKPARSGTKSGSSSFYKSAVVMTSNDAVNSPPLLTTAEKLVLDVLNSSVSLITYSNKADDFKNSDMDLEPPSPSVSPVFSPERITERNVTTPHEETRTTLQLFNSEDSEITSHKFRPGRMCQSATSPTTKHVQIDKLSEHVVEHTLDMVISVLESEGLLPLQKSSNVPDVSSSSSNKSVESDLLACCGTTDKSQSPTQSSCSDSDSQLSLEARKVVSETLVELQKKLSDESLIRTYSPENTDAINELINGILKQIQESPSLDGNQLNSSSSSESTFRSFSDAQSGWDSELTDVAGDTVSSWFLDEFNIPESCFDEDLPADQNWLELLTETHLDLWLCALIAEEVMKIHSLSQTEAKNERAEDTSLKNTSTIDVPKTSGSDSDASTSDTAENPTGTKQKKTTKARNFFRRAWKALKQTFTRRSNKIAPI
ncbi:uncharacterized protein LOC134320861 [Trichomycterus rosablanca]|uniref:uncharacterized protein LOC134320861 n=1 Tax=Trichomycterus rosablanca TaxID=2290929 RepID=UPI002F35AC98